MPAPSTIQLQLKQHEQWLIGLHRDPCMTAAKIKDALYNEYHVTASLSQLETFFRNVGERKNLSRSEWRTVLCALDSQKKFNRTYNLLFKGRPVSDESLRKKRRNARPTLALASCLADADRLLTQLPYGVTVKPRMPHDQRDNIPQHGINDQPVLHVVPSVTPDEQALGPHGSVSTASDVVLDVNALTPRQAVEPNSIGPQSPITGIENQAQHAISSTDMVMHSDHVIEVSQNMILMGSPPFRLNFEHTEFEMSEAFRYQDFPDIVTGLTPSATFQLCPHFQDNLNQNGSVSAEAESELLRISTPNNCIHELSLLESARRVDKETFPVIPSSGSLKRHKSSPTAEELLDNLQSLVSIEAIPRVPKSLISMDPSGVESHGSSDVILGSNSSTEPFIQLFIFSIINNFAGLDTIPRKLIMRFINQHDLVRHGILSYLRERPSTITAIGMVERLFEAAIEDCDTKTIRDILLWTMVKPDDFVCTQDGYPTRTTPLEKASRLRHVAVMRLLLDFDADVDKTYNEKDPFGERGALEHFICFSGDHHQIDLELVDLLLSKGATVRGQLVKAAVRWGDIQLIEKLMSRLPSSEHEYCFQHVLPDVAAYLRNDLGLRIVSQVIQACEKKHDNLSIRSYRRVVDSLMEKAARRMNKELVEFLLPHGGQDGLDGALVAASRAGCHSLVRWLLEHGARADGPVRCIDDVYTTPLAEAIRSDVPELLELFEEKGAWDKIGAFLPEKNRRHDYIYFREEEHLLLVGEYGHLNAALLAIAETDKSAHLTRVLSLVPNAKPGILSRALCVAIGRGHEDVAMRLLEAGADVNKKTDLGGRALGPALSLALKVKSESLTWAILESNAEVKYEKLKMYDDRYSTLDTNNQRTALELAIKWGDPRVIKALLDMGADTNSFKRRSPLTLAVKTGKRPLINLLIKHGAKLATKRDSPLAVAVKRGDRETAEYLLDLGADLADEEVLLTAIPNNPTPDDRNLFHYLFRRFRKQYPKGRPGFGGRVLIYVICKSDDALLAECLSAGFDVNSMVHFYMSPLGYTISKYRGNRLELISKLMHAGGDANAIASRRTDDDGIVEQETAFLLAIGTKSLPLVKLLISLGADVGKEARLGVKRTPLQKACEVQSLDIIDVLLGKKVDVNAPPAVRGGATALQLAAKAGSVRIAKSLLDAGADVNGPVSRGGSSAINCASQYGRLHMIKLLWDSAGGRFDAGQYESAIQLAQQNGHPACANLLMKLSSEGQGFIEFSG